MTSPNDIVVVGGGLAGVRTAERLRARGHDGPIRLLAAEPRAPYDRPPLSKQILRGTADDSTLRTPDELLALGVELHLGDPVTGIDSQAQSVITTNGMKFGYDALVLATGAKPRRVPGLGGVVLRTLDDARFLQKRLRDRRSLTLIGAGLIGCEVAASARALGLKVDLVDTAPAPMLRVVGPVVATEIARLHEANGVRLHMTSSATRSTGGDLVASDGAVLGSDVILEAIGSIPDTAWLEGSELPLDDGISCDGSGRVVDGIYAVGDVANWAGHRSEHWTAAVTQADIVAAAVLDQPVPEPEIAYWWSDQYDLKIQGVGSPSVDDDAELVRWGPKQRLVAVYSSGGLTTGAVGFSAPGAIARLRGDVTARTPVSEVLNRLAG